jgi:hypothetical protein
MTRLLLGAQIGIDAARHLAWFVSHQVNGAAPRD